MTTWRDASFLLLQTKEKKKTNELAAHVGQEMTSHNAGNTNGHTAIHAAKCKCMNLDPQNMHIGRTASWTKWEQLRRAVHGSTLSWAGREARLGVTTAVLHPIQSDVCTGGNKFQRWRSRYGSCTSTRKDQQLAHLVSIVFAAVAAVGNKPSGFFFSVCI